MSSTGYISPSDVQALTKPTDGMELALCLLSSCNWFLISRQLGFLCPLSANVFGIEFLQFTISDYQSKKVIFEVGKDTPAPQDIAVDFSSLGEDMYRKIKYTFSEDVLKLPLIQTTWVCHRWNSYDKFTYSLWILSVHAVWFFKLATLHWMASEWSKDTISETDLSSLSISSSVSVFLAPPTHGTQCTVSLHSAKNSVRIFSCAIYTYFISLIGINLFFM